jgi:hypothetical protein
MKELGFALVSGGVGKQNEVQASKKFWSILNVASHG